MNLPSKITLSFFIFLSINSSFGQTNSKIKGILFTTEATINAFHKSQSIRLLVNPDDTIELTQHESNPPTEALLPSPPPPSLLYTGKISDLSIVWVNHDGRKIPARSIPNSNFALSMRVLKHVVIGADLYDKYYLVHLSEDKKEILKEEEIYFTGILYKSDERKTFGE